MLHRYNLDSHLTASQKQNLSNLLLLDNRRKERAQMKGTICSAKCPKCQLSFISELSLKHHLSQERLQAVCKLACELRETLFTFDSQTNHSVNNNSGEETNSESSQNLAFSLSSAASETDFQIEVDLFQNESFCTSLEHLSNTWETFLLYRTSFGLYGSLVEQVGHLLSLVPNDCKLALCKIGLNNVTLEMISNLLPGIEFHPSHPSTSFFNTHFLKGEAWLEDMHLECFRELLYHDGFFYPSGISKPIMLTPYFFTYLHSDAIKTMDWLKQLLIQEKLWIDGQFLFENMLIPACIKNSHWILIHINVWNHTFFPINPYHPTEPHQGDFDRCHTLIENISQYFKLPNLYPSMPAIINQLSPNPRNH